MCLAYRLYQHIVFYGGFRFCRVWGRADRSQLGPSWLGGGRRSDLGAGMGVSGVEALLRSTICVHLPVLCLRFGGASKEADGTTRGGARTPSVI